MADRAQDGSGAIRRVYLAGPMRGIEAFNFPAFAAATASLRGRGYEVWSPHEHDLEEGFDPTTGDGLKTLRDYMRVDLAQVLDADAVVVLPDWEKSQGAALEVHVAHECGLTVLSYPALRPTVLRPTPVSRGTIDPVRTFETGATRDTDEGKHDYEGFFSPLVLRQRAAYMHRHRTQSDGSLRDSDNWQKGIPRDQYMKSAFRHLMDWWRLHRSDDIGDDAEEAICALMFNCEGYLHEMLRGERCISTPLA